MNFLSGIVKYVLFAFNFLIVVCGIILITIGGIIIANENKGLDSFTDFSVGGFAIGVGIVIFLIAAFGCYGAITENSRLLTAYAAILIVLLILQIVLGALAFVVIQDDDQLQKKVTTIVQKVFDQYVNQELQGQNNLIDDIQDNFSCCGVFGSSYWTEDYGVKVPNSCCKNSDCGSNNPYQQGCAKAFKDLISSNIVIIGGVAIAFGVVELVGAIFAFVVRNRISEY